MEQKLADFRARRQAAQRDNSADLQCTTETEMETSQTDTKETSDSQHTTQSAENRHSTLTSAKKVRHAPASFILEQFLSNLTLLKVLLWLVLLGLFVELEFGLPFFVISLFYWLYEGLRSPAAREPGELSAYSVFNPDCQPLLGSLTAEQLEGEMGYRPLANR
uniref:SAYSVFN motif domain containing 1 n=1 Tax=Labrus bergylta TaxID=56723 RepID=A0A3Q3F7U3_9LABR